MKVFKIPWIPFDKANPPINLDSEQEVLILLREDNYDHGATWRYSVDVAIPEVVAYAEFPYSLSENDLKEMDIAQ